MNWTSAEHEIGESPTALNRDLHREFQGVAHFAISTVSRAGLSTEESIKFSEQLYERLNYAVRLYRQEVLKDVKRAMNDL